MTLGIPASPGSEVLEPHEGDTSDCFFRARCISLRSWAPSSVHRSIAGSCQVGGQGRSQMRGRDESW